MAEALNGADANDDKANACRMAEAVPGVNDGHHLPESGSGVSRLKVVGRLILRYPHVFIIPLAVLGLMLGLGIWGVQRGQTHLTDQHRQSATWEATNAAQDLDLQFERATLALKQAAAAAQKEPNVPKFLQTWDSVVDSWWMAAPRGLISRSLIIQGVTRRHDMYTTGSPKPAPEYYGTDVLALNSPYRPLALALMVRQPNIFMSPIVDQFGIKIFSFGKRVAVPNVEANETFGSGRDWTACPICYNATTRTKSWGTIGMSVVIEEMLNASPYLQMLNQKGYQWQLQRPAYSFLGENTTTVVPVMNVNEPMAPDHAIRVMVQAVDQQWELAVWKGSSWDEDLNYLYAVVVITSVVIAGLLFAVLLSRVEHQALLHSLLPKETINRMRAEAQWVTSHEEEFKAIKLDTPAQGLLTIINLNLENIVPPLPRLLAMRDALQRSVDVYRPMAGTVQQRMAQLHVDAEVQEALVAQLVGRTSDDRNTHASNAAGADVSAVVQDLQLKDSAITCEEASQATPTSDRITTACSNVLSTDEINSELLSALMSNPGTNHISGDNIRIDSADMQSPAVRDLFFGLPLDGTLDVHKAALLYFVRSNHSKHPFNLGRAVSNASAAILSVTGNCNRNGLTEQQRTKSLDLVLESHVTPKPPAVLLTEVEAALVTADSWSFDAYAFEAATCGHPLSTLGYWLLNRTGLMKWAKMDTVKLVRFLQQMESGYSSSNPYHNRRHAADVLQSLHVIVHRGGLRPNYIDANTLLACYLAAIVHDYEHKGRNNDYLINSDDELALTYNDRSPMENHHLAAAFKVLRQAECNCLSGLSKGAKTRLRKTVIELVLATDMKQHFAILGQFDALHGSAYGSRPSCAGSERSTVPVLDDLPVLAPLSDTDRLLSLQLAMKCADLGHLTAPLSVHLNWVKDLEEEFFRQGDAEKAAGLTVSPLCDRMKEGVFKSQVGFFDFVAVPLFKAFTGRFTAASPLRNSLMKNKKHWLSQLPVAPTPTEDAGKRAASQ